MHWENKLHIPTEQDLTRLYFELAEIGAPCVGTKTEWQFHTLSKEELLALAFEWIRYDPRLLSILIMYLKDHYSELNPYLLRKFIKKNASPQTVGVVGEFLKQTKDDQEIKFMFDYLCQGFLPRHDELFFIGLHPIGSKIIEKTVAKSLKEYRKWGFLGIEKPMIDLVTKKTIGSYETSYRKKVLKQLLDRNKKITLSTYLEAVNNSISRQQALYDLKHFFALKLMGKGRGAYWQKQS